MSELDQQLRQLVKQACNHPPGSPIRQRNLTQVIRLCAGKLWRDSAAYYPDALQQTWVYFCQNVCEATTGDRYDPDRSSVSTWLNSYLRRRLQDFSIDAQKQQVIRVTGLARSSRSGETGDVIDPVEMLPAEPDVPPILQEVRDWAIADSRGELKAVHIEGHAEITCQLLILRRLPPETGWKQLSAEMGLSVSTLSSFYQRKCLPRLRKFGQSEGYL